MCIIPSRTIFHSCHEPVTATTLYPVIYRTYPPQNEKVLLLCNIGEDVQERIRKLQEDRNNISFTSQVWAEQSLRRSPRTPLGVRLEPYIIIIIMQISVVPNYLY